MNFAAIISDSPRLTALGWTLLHFVWQGALIAATAALILRLLHRRQASTRYVLACAMMALMTAAPVATYFVLFSSDKPFAVRQIAPPIRADGRVIRLTDFPVEWDDEENKTPPPSRWSDGLVRTLHASVPFVVAFWMAGIGLLTVRLAGGWVVALSIARRATAPVTEKLLACAEELQRSLGDARRATVRVTSKADIPCVVGWLRPVIVFPEAILGMPPQYLSALLAHELAHIHRHDYLINLLQSVVETLLFFHPAIWWLSSRIRNERENCCDDLAARLCGNTLCYARALAELELIRHTPARLALSAADGSLLHRIRRLVGVSEIATSRATAPCVGIVILLVIAVTSWARAEIVLKPTQAQSQTLQRLDAPLALGQQKMPLSEVLARAGRAAEIPMVSPIECDLMRVDHEFGNAPLRDDFATVLGPLGMTYRIEADGRIRIVTTTEVGQIDRFKRDRLRLTPDQLRACVMDGEDRCGEWLMAQLDERPGMRDVDRTFFKSRLEELIRLLPTDLVVGTVQLQVRRTKDGVVRYAISAGGMSRRPAVDTNLTSEIEKYRDAIAVSVLFASEFDAPVLRLAAMNGPGGRTGFNLTIPPAPR
ncbi:MAG: M56 family metallopeptidase [Planctomycetota bacterium]